MPLTRWVDGDGVSLERGEDIVQDELVAVHTNKKIYKANAATGYDQQIPAIGIDEVGGDEGTTAEVKTRGVLEGKNTGISGLTVGGIVYLGETDGDFTSTEPDTSGDIVQAVGIALSETRVMLDISSYYETVT